MSYFYPYLSILYPYNVHPSNKYSKNDHR